MPIQVNAASRYPCHLDPIGTDPFLLITDTILLGILILINDVVKAPDSLINHLTLLVYKFVWLSHFLPADVVTLDREALLIEHWDVIACHYSQLIRVKSIHLDRFAMEKVDKFSPT